MQVKVVINDKSLKYFIITKKLIRYQAHWVKFLLRFYFVIFYILDKKNQKPDLLNQYQNDLLFNNDNNCQQDLL